MIIAYSPRFFKVYKKLSLEIKKKVEERECVFKMDPFDPSLKTHKLNGEFSDLWAFSVDYKTRIIFEFENQKTARFHVIGSHDIY
jgi:mRNA-degrading endonuclease YafQ of YafQ-DinJ toxin-antitoxin module